MGPRTGPQHDEAFEILVNERTRTHSCAGVDVDHETIFEGDNDSLDFEPVRVKVDNVHSYDAG